MNPVSISHKTIYPPEEFTYLEAQRISQFRSKCLQEKLNLSPEQLSDPFLIRWLKARNFDVEKAYLMLQLSCQWRQDNDVDGILERETLPPDVHTILPFAMLGVDICGYPIQLFPVGRHDTRTLLEKYGTDQCFKFNIIGCELMMEILRKTGEAQGRPVTKFVQIIDLEGYSLRQFTSKLCRDFVFRIQKSIEPNYPEMLHYAVIINAPTMFYILFNLIKPFIPKRTLDKMHFYGPDKEKWVQVLKEKFPMDQVPPHWGGTRPGSDAYCSQDDIWKYGPVPLSFFGVTEECTPNLDENGTLAKIYIGRRGTFKITLNADKKGSVIGWRFRSKYYDVGFKIVYQDDKLGKEVIVVPFKRVESQSEVQEGKCPCERLGAYCFIFDNGYSWTRAKSVYYKVAVNQAQDN